jgi:dimethylglycine dehydrogenase
VHAEHVVNAGGLWAREVGRMVGLELPVLAMEHQYLITEDMPELVGQKEQLHCIDFEGEIYMRQERGGMLLGTYERAGVPWSPRTTPWDFGQDLLPNDLERIAPSLEVGFEHFPRLGQMSASARWSTALHLRARRQSAGRPGARAANYWVACGVMAGFSQGGGVGLALSHWMIEGDPGADIWGMDVARYGDWATLAYTNAKVRENYPALSHPLSERGAGCGAAAAHHADLRAAAVAKTRCSANTAGSSIRCGSHPRARTAA